MPARSPSASSHGQPQTNAGVLNGVVLIDVQVAAALDLQIQRRVLGQKRQHVVEESDAAGDLRAAAAVEVDLQADFGLRGFALNGGRACHVATDSSLSLPNRCQPPRRRRR